MSGIKKKTLSSATTAVSLTGVGDLTLAGASSSTANNSDANKIVINGGNKSAGTGLGGSVEINAGSAISGATGNVDIGYNNTGAVTLLGGALAVSNRRITYTTTGYKYVKIPRGVTSMTVKLWGAGGGGGNYGTPGNTSNGGNGGGGGYATLSQSVSAGQVYVILVGAAGGTSTNPLGGGPSRGGAGSGQGGQASAIWFYNGASYNVLAVAGGGGGGGGGGNSAAGAGRPGGGGGVAGTSATTSTAGAAGSGGTGGAAGTSSGTAFAGTNETEPTTDITSQAATGGQGGAGSGGNGVTDGGGGAGGGGYGGGGGGGCNGGGGNAGSGGGGGGMLGTTTSNGSGTTPGNTTDVDYVNAGGTSTYASGGTGGTYNTVAPTAGKQGFATVYFTYSNTTSTASLNVAEAQISLGQLSNRKLTLYEDTPGSDHQFYGFGANSNVLRYQTSSTGADHVFYAGASGTTSNELFRIAGTGTVTAQGNISISKSSPSITLVPSTTGISQMQLGGSAPISNDRATIYYDGSSHNVTISNDSTANGSILFYTNNGTQTLSMSSALTTFSQQLSVSTNGMKFSNAASGYTPSSLDIYERYTATPTYSDGASTITATTGNFQFWMARLGSIVIFYMTFVQFSDPAGTRGATIVTPAGTIPARFLPTITSISSAQISTFDGTTRRNGSYSIFSNGSTEARLDWLANWAASGNEIRGVFMSWVI